MSSLALLTLAVAVIATTDMLAAAANSRVTVFNGNWWGSAEEYPWAQAAAHGLTFQSRDLSIKIKGDQLNAVYTLTAPADSVLAKTAETDAGSDAGDDLVDDVLGQVEVGEFHYGFTGHQLTMTALTFNTPQLQIAEDKSKHLIATVIVSSDSFRLFEQRQQITIVPPSPPYQGGPATKVQVQVPGAQVTSPSGVSIVDIADGQADLLLPAKPGQAATPGFTVSESQSPNWFDGLRAVGGITLPVTDGFLNRLSTIFVFGIFLWAFYRARREFPENRLVSAGLKVVQTIVGALLAVAVIGLANDICATFIAQGAAGSYAATSHEFLLAGPLGLLIGGALAVWPAACWRAGTADRDSAGPVQPGRQSRPWLRARVLACMYGGLACIYVGIVVLCLFRLTRLHVGPLTSAPVIIGIAVPTLVVPVLVRLLLGRGGLLAWAASAGVLGSLFAAATSWPLLTFSSYSQWQHAPHVNPLGKWTYVAVAVTVAAGLCVQWGRTAWTALGPWRARAGKVAATAAVVAVIAAAIVPDAVSEAGVASPHGDGLVPAQLFGLLDAVTQLLAWLLLVLAIVVVTRLPGTPDSRSAARDMALPIALVLLYWSDTWLYLPVTVIAGIILIRWLMMPKDLASKAPPARGQQQWANDAAADWRHAEFIAGQQQALATSGTDALREAVLDGKDGEFQDRLDRLRKAQDTLGERMHDYQDAARDAKVSAFSFTGVVPGGEPAKAGAVTGAILGVIPATITVLTTQPPPTSGYPILGFFGSTAWNLLSWVGLGWFIGYYLPLIRGRNGVEKALCVFVVGAAAGLPDSLIWNDPRDWAFTIVGDLELLVFLMMATVITCDLYTLQRDRLRPTDWVRVHNWRFVATWSAALVAAVGTIAITFATTTVTDLSKQLTARPSPATSQSAGQSAGQSASQSANQSP